MNPPGWLGASRIRLGHVDSTSDEVWRRAADGAPHGMVISAETQSAGRGRQGRSWSGRPGDLMASWLLRLDERPASPAALSIVEGLALAGVIDRWAPGRIRLKWPNDLLLDGRKLGGLLLESRNLPEFCVVSGLGLNLRTPEDGWGDLEGRAIALDRATAPGAAPVSAEALLDELLPALETATDRFLREGAAAALADWPRWSALDGREIRWDDRGARGRGVVLGLAEDGGLRVRVGDATERTLRAGEVHLEGSA